MSVFLATDKEKLINDSGKLMALDMLLRSRADGASDGRLLIYSTMPKMLELLEEYLRNRSWAFCRIENFCNSSNLNSNSSQIVLCSPRINFNFNFNGGLNNGLDGFDAVSFAKISTSIWQNLTFSTSISHAFNVSPFLASFSTFKYFWFWNFLNI